MTPNEGIQPIPAPWKLKGTSYIFNFWTSTDDDGKLPQMAYSPLEYSSPYSSLDNGRPLAGLSMIQLIRYTESPAGPYDEFILSPGRHEYIVEEGGRHVKKKAHRITRIYVSQKYTCWNGRKNWNIPKHLAKFDWITTPDGRVTVKVFRYDLNSEDPSEAKPSQAPFFQASFQPISYLPAFPFSMNILKYLGQEPKLVHPPLPEGNGSHSELPGTQQWCSVTVGQRSLKTRLGWFDIQQSHADDASSIHNENFWPGLGRWHLGIVMENCVIDFPAGTYWDPPRSTL